MIFSIDHIVFATSREQSRALRERLALAGFEPEHFHLEFPEIGAASDSLSYEGGGFVEFVVELDATRSPRMWFDDAPRIIGLGFGSDNFETDTPWAQDPGGWAMDEDHTLSDGSRLNIRAAGPHEHLSDFFIFVMDRPERTLQFSNQGASPKLKRLTFKGAAADRWKQDLRGWLKLQQSDGDLQVGDVELRFTPDAHPSIRVSPTFEVDSGSGVVALTGSSLELAPR